MKSRVDHSCSRIIVLLTNFCHEIDIHQMQSLNFILTQKQLQGLVNQENFYRKRNTTYIQKQNNNTITINYILYCYERLFNWYDCKLEMKLSPRSRF